MLWGLGRRRPGWFESNNFTAIELESASPESAFREDFSGLARQAAVLIQGVRCA
jgi:hypothetical protein